MLPLLILILFLNISQAYQPIDSPCTFEQRLSIVNQIIPTNQQLAEIVIIQDTAQQISVYLQFIQQFEEVIRPELPDCADGWLAGELAKQVYDDALINALLFHLLDATTNAADTDAALRYADLLRERNDLQPRQSLNHLTDTLLIDDQNTLEAGLPTCEPSPFPFKYDALSDSYNNLKPSLRHFLDTGERPPLDVIYAADVIAATHLSIPPPLCAPLLERFFNESEIYSTTLITLLLAEIVAIEPTLAGSLERSENALSTRCEC